MGDPAGVSGSPEPPLWRRRRISNELWALRRSKQGDGKQASSNGKGNTKAMTTLTAKDSTFEELPDDIYAAQLTEFEEIKEGEYGPRIKLVWTLDEVVQEDGSPREKWQWVSQKLTPKSTLWAVSKALGVTPDLGSNYELDEYMSGLVGRRAQLVVKTVDGPKGPRATITDLLPVKGPAKRPTSPAAQTAVADADVRCDDADCSEPVDYFTSKGKGFCANHGPKAEL